MKRPRIADDTGVSCGVVSDFRSLTGKGNRCATACSDVGVHEGVHGEREAIVVLWVYLPNEISVSTDSE